MFRSQIKRVVFSTASLLIIFGLASAQAYTPKVTKSDIAAGGGKCAGNLCTINGKMWDCSGGGYCTLIKS